MKLDFHVWKSGFYSVSHRAWLFVTIVCPLYFLFYLCLVELKKKSKNAYSVKVCTVLNVSVTAHHLYLFMNICFALFFCSLYIKAPGKDFFVLFLIRIFQILISPSLLYWITSHTMSLYRIQGQFLFNSAHHLISVFWNDLFTLSSLYNSLGHSLTFLSHSVSFDTPFPLPNL